MIALDLDGTLLTTDKRVTQASIDALMRAHADGARIVIVTGRNLPMARKSVAVLPMPLTFIAHNGAVTKHADDDAPIETRHLPPRTAEGICEAFRETGCEPFLYVADGDACALQPAKVEPSGALDQLEPVEPIVIADGGETSGWVASAAQVHAPGHFLSHGYLGCLGVGLPFAIAAKVAHPDKPVVCVSGDGSIGLNFSEFDTMVRHGLSIVTVINNDTIWGMSAHGQDILFGRERRAATAPVSL